MAPEQARGQARHLDRRADVYSLGAILYEMLVGRPPFDADNEVDLLLAVLNQEPQSPRQLDASLPVDLEVIALKCLRKEPEQRYESALALAEDLQRYVRGESIVARPVSTLYRLRRFAWRHRAWVVVAALALIGTCIEGAILMRKRAAAEQQLRRANDRQHLAAELGQTTSRLDLFLRVAYSLPLHPLQREQRVVRQDIDKLQQQRATADPYLHGTIESAIGAGYLALREYEPAVQHLQSAVQLGEQTASAHLALGQALGHLYEQKEAELLRRLDGEQIRPQREALRRSLLVPAQKELKLGQSAELASPTYLQALMHYYGGEREYDAALQGARQAQKEAPWLLEPLALELKIITQRYGEGIKKDTTAAQRDASAVHDAIARAIGIARSYPEFYGHFADYSFSRLRALVGKNVPLQDHEGVFTEAVAHAKAAISLQPDSGDAHDQLADIYAIWAYLQSLQNVDPRQTVQQGLAARSQL